MSKSLKNLAEAGWLGGWWGLSSSHAVGASIHLANLGSLRLTWAQLDSLELNRTHWHSLGSTWRHLDTLSPECTKYCACASKIAQGTGNAQLAKTPKLHEAPRLCITNGLRPDNCWIGLAAQNARSTALCIKNCPGHRKCTVGKNTQKARSATPVHNK